MTLERQNRVLLVALLSFLSKSAGDVQFNTVGPFCDIQPGKNVLAGAVRSHSR
jgi:hypothetical protein